MRDLVLHIATSIDGYIAGPNDEIDWLMGEGDYGMSDFFKSVDTILWGARTYRIGVQLGFEPFEGLKHYVFSRTMTEVSTANTHIVSSDIAEFTKKLKAENGKNIWLMGGAQVANELLQAGLVDGIVLSIHPIVLGSGIPLFANGGRRVDYRLVGSKSYDDGLLQIEYRLIS